MIDTIHESWKPLFLNGIDKELFRELNALSDDSIYPEKENIFRAFEMPIDDIKVVILGQDPYPKPDQAVGLAFAVSARVPKPTSLRNIEKELGKEIDRTLISWMEQGVFLLNTALTVKRGFAGSHLQLWEDFTKKVIKYISEVNPTIWMLWGKYAQNYSEHIKDHVYEYPKLDELHMNVLLTAAHPAAESYRSNAGFYGCNHFKKANGILKQLNKKEIDW